MRCFAGREDARKRVFLFMRKSGIITKTDGEGGGDLNIENLRAFVTVAETLNFRKAAEILYLSQSALSRQILE